MKLKSVIAMAAGVISAFMLSTTVFAATNELTGLDIDDSIANQRPVAIMVDNEKKALKHYGTGEADIVYEMMNSTANGRVTRLMCLYKDWANLQQTGSIRSTRTTNVILSDEYNAVLIHDGGPFYIKTYLAQPYATHISGGFTRVKNGKPTEFTEYVFGSELVKRFNKANISTSYVQAPERGTHFVFNAADTDLISDVVANNVDLASVFTHNSSKLVFNAATRTYDYYEYGSLHQDAEDDQVLSFKNVILQNVSFTQLDKNGYLTYNVIGTDKGYYITNGKAIPITWSKASETGMTHYYNAAGQEITVNKGKTYIGLVPSDSWDKMVIN
ncbi:DUF3048 domain-containing protein [Butyrivibrio sp. YAB3001]|uniref:DUF3048 domain-containing protein n=1 Tax=Butyrivibrio sp. YAB3001 TaxID=1520812 RepID=UPI0008F679D7|nr:DUF3048 domain-containing protein [Butyrivibrio sp. YAB3001]SFC86648.1 Protein of unknown function [Butyrivibrio sp. YAB3001]